jgi:hypothetical protein
VLSSKVKNVKSRVLAIEVQQSVEKGQVLALQSVEKVSEALVHRVNKIEKQIPKI